MHLNEQTAHELRDRLEKKEISSEDIVKDVFAAIRQKDETLHAYLDVDEEGALAQARDVDRRREQGAVLGPLAGIPVAIKDNMCVEGMLTRCASKIIESYRAPYDATVVQRLKQAGAVLLGKTNLDEFAMGSSTENSAFGPSRNPYGVDYAPGGSSGGSAVAVAGDETILALGSDTGGSIRQPASFCGIVGLKPTYGRVSRYGLIAFASSLDQIGPMTKDVYDAALLLEVIAGADVYDATCVSRDVPSYAHGLSRDIKGLRVGVPKEYFAEGLASDVSDAMQRALKVYEGLGAEIHEMSLPHTEYCVATYYIVATAEASSNLARYDGVQYGHRTESSGGLRDLYFHTRGEGFGPEVKRRILLGTYVLSSGYYEAYYLKAQKVRSLIKQDFDQAFQSLDVILTPTSPTTAFRIGEKTNDPLSMYLSDICTISANLSGIPGISLPCGANAAGLPIGLQILGKPFDEPMLLRAAYAFEQNTNHHRGAPKVAVKEQS